MGGDKSTQQKDIDKAKEIWDKLKSKKWQRQNLK
jgi:pentatricopeptide repeat protein